MKRAPSGRELERRIRTRAAFLARRARELAELVDRVHPTETVRLIDDTVVVRGRPEAWSVIVWVK